MRSDRISFFVCRPAEENACTSREFGDGPMAKKHAGDKKSLDKKKKEKKKVLKRLWWQLPMDTPFSFSTQWTKPLELDISAVTSGLMIHLSSSFGICIHVWLYYSGGSKHVTKFIGPKKTVWSVCYVWLVTAVWLTVTRVFKCLKGLRKLFFSSLLKWLSVRPLWYYFRLLLSCSVFFFSVVNSVCMS